LKFALCPPRSGSSQASPREKQSLPRRSALQCRRAGCQSSLTRVAIVHHRVRVDEVAGEDLCRRALQSIVVAKRQLRDSHWLRALVPITSIVGSTWTRYWAPCRCGSGRHRAT
jgi:hypothetical protein